MKFFSSNTIAIFRAGACGAVFGLIVLLSTSDILQFKRIAQPAAVADAAEDMAETPETNPAPTSTPIEHVEDASDSPNEPVTQTPTPTPPSVGGSNPTSTSPTSTPVAQPTPVPAPPTPSPTPISEVIKPVPASKNGATVWMDINDWGTAVSSVEKNAAHIAEVSPAWFVASADGSVHEREGIPVNDRRLLDAARKNGIIVRPIVMNLSGKAFDGDATLTVFRDPELRSKQIKSLQKIVVDNDYDGLDLDYEDLTGTEITELAQFVEDLASSLHSVNATLAVSIQAFPDDSLLPAWKRIGIAADSVRLMAYGQRHKTPQAVVKPSSMQSHLVRALRAIPSEKLSLGMPTYCFIWNGSTVGSGTWMKMLSTAKDVQRDPATLASWYVAGEKTVWCEDGQSISNKVNIAKSLGVNKFALWRIGGEDPSLWNGSIRW